MRRDESPLFLSSKRKKGTRCKVKFVFSKKPKEQKNNGVRNAGSRIYTYFNYMQTLTHSYRQKQTLRGYRAY